MARYLLGRAASLLLSITVLSAILFALMHSVPGWPFTLQVGALTLLIVFPVGILLGTIAAFNQNSWIDTLVTFGATLGMTVPNFVVGTVLVFVFAVELGWLPTGGWGEWRHMLMPVIAYSLTPMAL